MGDIRLKKITVEASQSPLIIQNGDVSITNTTISSSILNGALVSNGGISINTTYDASSSTAGGSLTVGGGIGVMKSVYVGKDLNIDSSNGLIIVGGLTENRLYLDNIVNKHFYISPDGINRRFDLYDSVLQVNIATASVNSTTGGFCIQGGISINSSQNVINGSNGGALTVAGGVAIGKDLNVSKSLSLGETFSNNYGIQLRYTGTNQLILNNSSGTSNASLNMNGNEFIIGNNNNISIRSSNGNISFINSVTGFTMATVHSNYTEFSKYIYISDNTLSNASVASLMLSGGQSILSTSDVTSLSSGGSFTTLGGVAINKKTLAGDTIGIDIQNANKNNKLILYGNLNETNTFTGLGSISGGSLIYNVSGVNNDHVFYCGTVGNINEVFRIRGTNEVVFKGVNQQYSFLGRDNSLVFQGNGNSKSSSLEFFTKDTSNSYSNDIRVYGLGVPNDITNGEYLKIGWDQNNYVISTHNMGTGVLNNLVLQSGINDQIVLQSNGQTIMNSTRESTNSTSGALVLQGGVSINCTVNSNNISSGGALTIAGGMSVSKDILIGGQIVLNGINFKTEGSSSSYSSLVISGSENKYPAIKLTGNSSQVESRYPFKMSLFSLGDDELNVNNEYFILTTAETSGYALTSKSNGTGNDRYIEIYSGMNSNQLVLQTSGNIGINNSNPQYNLDISGTLNCSSIVTFTCTNPSESVSSASLILSGGLSILSTEDAVSASNGGGITVAGGVSIGKTLLVGGIAEFMDTTPSTSYYEASVIVHGGLSIQAGDNAVNVGNGGGLSVQGGASIGGDLYVGGSINGSGSSSSTYAYLTLTATDEAINLSSGSLVTLGGITIQADLNASSVSNGGGLLVNGGGSVAKDFYIGGNNYIYGVSNYKSNSNNVINFYDSLNIKRFSLDKNTLSHNLSITRYNSLGNSIEKTFDISSSDGTIVFNNTTVSSSVSSAAIIIKGGISIGATTLAQSEINGGAVTIAGGVGIASNVYVGGDVVMKSTTQSNDTSSGSLILKGGLGISGNLNVLGNTLIVGNLTVNGQTTSVDTTNTVIKDNILVLNSAPAGSSDSGIIVQRYQSDNDIASGDIVNATDPLVLIIPSQTGLTTMQVKLHSSASAIDNYYNGYWVKITSGFSNNQVRKIISYSGSTKIASISSAWTSQNPSGGDSVYLYNKPIVGVIFNELNDRFEFGSTTQDPGQTNVAFTDYVPIHFSSASSVSTTVSSSSTVGSVLIAGGISISNTMDAESITSGGTLTTLGGASIGKTLYSKSLNVNGVNMTPNQGDIFTSITYSVNNNQTMPIDVNGLFFSSVWAFDCYLTSRVLASTNLYSHFHIRGVNKSGSWEIIKTYVGDDSGIEFYITNAGQLQYTTPNWNSFVSCVFKARALVN
jgi:hypothetical protein